jgi:hypothetical protein
MRCYYPTGLQTLLYDMNTAPLIDNRVNAAYSLNRGSASNGSTCRTLCLRRLGICPSPHCWAPNLPSTRGAEEWFRLATTFPIPEPGSWTMLIAGLLRMCAVARRRIFSI